MNHFEQAQLTNNREKKEKELSKEELTSLQGIWANVVGGKEFNADGLNKEELKKALYESLKPAIEETMGVLGIKMPDPELIQRMREAKDVNERTKIQKEIIDGISRQIKEIPSAKWSFFPKEIQETKKLNCSGAAFIAGYALNKLEIKTLYGQPTGHALNIAELADGSLAYIDSRNRSESVEIGKDKMEIEERGGVRVLKIDIPGIEYKIIPLSPEEGALSSIIGNFESLKNEAKKATPTEEHEKEAAKIYSRSQHLLSGTDFEKLDEKLHPELINYLKSEEFRKEEERVKELHRKSRKKSGLGMLTREELMKQLNDLAHAVLPDNQEMAGSKWKERTGKKEEIETRKQISRLYDNLNKLAEEKLSEPLSIEVLEKIGKIKEFVKRNRTTLLIGLGAAASMSIFAKDLPLPTLNYVASIIFSFATGAQAHILFSPMRKQKIRESQEAQKDYWEI